MVERRSARIVSNCYDRSASVTDMVNNLGWDSLELRRKRNRLTMMYLLHMVLLKQISISIISESHVRTSRIHIIWHNKLFRMEGNTGQKCYWIVP